ncbi:MAG: CBS domain-containing protein [Zetaproteobacteria bacterium]|nr:CBS domain-containing protein [Zetaproteobacteria bacterium]
MSTTPKNSSLFVRSSNTIETCLVHMVKRNTSCAVIVDESTEYVQGIVTERDIMRKIAGLDLKDRLLYKVNTIMSKPVHCVRRYHLLEDLRELHFNHGHRHFLVCYESIKNPRRDDVIGLIHPRHIFSMFLNGETLTEESLNNKLVEWFHADQL